MTLATPLSFLDNKYVVFARIIQGMRAFRLIDKIECVNERPISSIKIIDAGIFTIKKEG